MSLKFTGVFAIDNNPVEAATSRFNGNIEAAQYKVLESDKKSCIELTGGLIQLQHEVDKRQRKNELFKRIISEYQTNVKISESLRAEILKGQLAGESTDALLLKAAECISLMTGDKAFYTQIKKNL